MNPDANIVCSITCPTAPESTRAIFSLHYDGTYEDAGRIRNDVFERDFQIERGRSLFARFSEGTVVEFGHIAQLTAWTGALKRAVRSGGEFVWSYHVCDLSSEAAYSCHACYRPKGDRLEYSGDQLRFEFSAPLSSIEISDRPFGRAAFTSVFDVTKTA